MRKRLLALLGLLMTGTAQLSAQSLLPATAPIARPDAVQAPTPVAAPIGRPDALQAPTTVAAPMAHGDAQTIAPVSVQPARPDVVSSGPGVYQMPSSGNSGDAYRIWGRADYLLWWVKDAPLPIPLLTTGNPFDAHPGAIGQPGTNVVFGNNGQNFNAFSGISVTLGAWIDSDNVIGVEGSGFGLFRRTKSFSAASGADGNPLLAIPFFDPSRNRERALQVSNPTPPGGQLVGSVGLTSTLELWGAEFNGVFCLWARPGVEFSLLAGFRYADLRETLGLTRSSTDNLFAPPNVSVFTDSFNTRNQFYGGQLGGRVKWEGERVALDVTGKVALGSTHEVVEISGSGTQSFVPAAQNYGLFSGPSNIGRFTDDKFTVLPSLEVKVGYKITSNLQAVVGYNILYWNQVVRPGNQIDRNVNTSQNFLLSQTGGVLTGPVAPNPILNRSDFWAQGVNFGFEIRY